MQFWQDIRVFLTVFNVDQQYSSESTEEGVEIITQATPIPSKADRNSVSGPESAKIPNKPNGMNVTCRYYNKSQCNKGINCPYSHDPDLSSLRSHPEYVCAPLWLFVSSFAFRGPNVCLYFIHNNKCRFQAEKCNYSHRREDLRWDNERLAKELAKKLEARKNELKANWRKRPRRPIVGLACSIRTLYILSTPEPYWKWPLQWTTSHLINFCTCPSPVMYIV